MENILNKHFTALLRLRRCDQAELGLDSGGIRTCTAELQVKITLRKSGRNCKNLGIIRLRGISRVSFSVKSSTLAACALVLTICLFRRLDFVSVNKH